MTKNALDDNGERYLPWWPCGESHYHANGRYYFVKQLVDNRIVLDIASGEGHGSALLSQTAKKVIGVDINAAAVQFAKDKYKSNNLEFMHGNCCHIPIDGQNIFDVVSCMETLEHVDEKKQIMMLDEFSRLLKHDGILVISTPNIEYTDTLNHDNHFHKKELTFSELDKLLSYHFPFRSYFAQNNYLMNLISSVDKDEGEYKEIILKRENQAYVRDDIKAKVPQAYICVASKAELSSELAAILTVDKDNMVYNELMKLSEWTKELQKGKDWLEEQYYNYKDLYEKLLVESEQSRSASQNHYLTNKSSLFSKLIFKFFNSNG